MVKAAHDFPLASKKMIVMNASDYLSMGSEEMFCPGPYYRMHYCSEHCSNADPY
jgi:hypothetical protein